MKLMKVLSTAVAVMMVAVIPTTQAMAQNVSVENAINELNYAIAVEIDSKSADANELTRAAYDKFFAEMENLKAQGVSKEEIFATIKSKVLTAQGAKEVDSIIALEKAGRISAKDAQKQIINYANGAQGANWSSGATLARVGLTLVAVGFIALLIAAGSGGGAYYDCWYEWDYYYDYYYEVCGWVY